VVGDNPPPGRGENIPDKQKVHVRSKGNMGR
jgi:hypothetical protein